MIQEGYGIGDDEHSIAFDGCRQLMWHHAVSESQEVTSCLLTSKNGILLINCFRKTILNQTKLTIITYFNLQKNTRCWRPGDIVGSLLDLDKKKITFYLNGKELHSEFR